MTRHHLHTAFAAVIALALPACSLIVGDGVDNLRPDGNAKRDVTIRLRDWTAHVTQPTFIRFVNDENKQVDAHVVIDPSGTECFDVRLNRGAAFNAARIDFYADLNMNGVLDPPGPTGDHSWERDLDESGELLFIHDTMFNDLFDDPSSFVLSSVVVEITGMDEFDGASVSTLVVAQDLVDAEMNIRRRAVRGMYVTSVAAGTLSFELEGVADPGVPYDIEMIIGDNVQTCRIPEQTTPTAGGEPLRIEMAFDAIDCQPSSPPDCEGFDTACTGGDEQACSNLFEQCPFVDCGR